MLYSINLLSAQKITLIIEHSSLVFIIYLLILAKIGAYTRQKIRIFYEPMGKDLQ